MEIRSKHHFLTLLFARFGNGMWILFIIGLLLTAFAFFSTRFGIEKQIWSDSDLIFMYCITGIGVLFSLSPFIRATFKFLRVQNEVFLLNSDRIEYSDGSITGFKSFPEVSKRDMKDEDEDEDDEYEDEEEEEEEEEEYEDEEDDEEETEEYYDKDDGNEFKAIYMKKQNIAEKIYNVGTLVILSYSGEFLEMTDIPDPKKNFGLLKDLYNINEFHYGCNIDWILYR